jgi:hypothetical protein
MRVVTSLALSGQIGSRAREAASAGEATFAVPEISQVASWVAATVPDPRIRSDAAAWSSEGAGYHALVRLCARAVIALDTLWPPSSGAYRDKVQGELEPMLALWPDVILLPTTSRLTPLELIDLRGFPIHPLGLVDRPTWTDGTMDSPSEFFFHDLDHARFKVREDLLVEGVDLPDAYQQGSTFDAETGRHRLIMAYAADRIGGRLWARAASRNSLARQLREGLATLNDGSERAAAELLLFEIVHEKSFPLEAAILDRELGGEAHLAKLRMKATNRFFPGGTDAAVVEALPNARAALRELLA